MGLIIHAFKEGYVSSPAETVTVAPAQVIDQVNFILNPNASIIKGRITSSDGGVYNAQIDAFNSQKVSTNSDENGYFILNVKADKWLLTASKTGFISVEKDSILIGIGQTVSGINFNLEQNLITLQGTILYAGQPIRNVTISLPAKNLSTTSGSNGVFMLSVEQGEYQLVISKSGYRTVNINSSELLSNPTINLEKLISQFTGKVIDQNENPVAEVLVKAVSNIDSFQVLSNINGEYQLDVNPGTYEITAQKTGYKKLILFSEQVIGTDEIFTLPNIVLILDRGNIVGTVFSEQSELPLPLVRIIAREVSGFSAQSQTNDAGSFTFNNDKGEPILLPGIYRVIAAKPEFQPDTLFEIQVSCDEQTMVEIYLQKNTGKFIGNVVSEGNPVPDATISAKSLQTGDFFNTISRSNGTYEIKGLLPGSYELQVTCAGYTSPEPEIYDTDGDSIQFLLIKNNGKIFGSIKDEINLQPISGVNIFVDDAHGNNGTSLSKTDGNYEITALPQLYSYMLTASKSGYSIFTSSPLDISEPTQIDIQLRRFYADISGKITDEAQSPVENAIVLVKSNELLQTDTTDISGKFFFVNLPGNQYKITANKYGYLSNPNEQTINLWQGNDVTGVKFTMQEALAVQIKIIGPDNINNQTQQKFNFSAKTADLREASIYPKWEVDFEAGIDYLSQDGLLDPCNDFLGTLKLTLKDSITNVSVTKNISINQELTPGNSALNISDKCGVQLVLKDSCIAKNVILQLRKPELAKARRNSRAFEVVGDVYQLLPANIKFLQPAKIFLTIPEGQDYGELLIGKWNSDWLEWDSFDEQSVSDHIISAEIIELGRFAILRSAEPLSMKDLEIKPNPFSPHNGALKISYNITSDQTISPQVTIKIYNMVGDFVRTLVNGELQSRGENIVEWDGKTEQGKMALNGRYVIHFKIKDSSGEKEKLKTVVLIK